MRIGLLPFFHLRAQRCLQLRLTGIGDVLDLFAMKLGLLETSASHRAGQDTREDLQTNCLTGVLTPHHAQHIIAIVASTVACPCSAVLELEHRRWFGIFSMCAAGEQSSRHCGGHESVLDHESPFN
ncbi:hypothetical protein D3C71_1624760 [compost metagenome]